MKPFSEWFKEQKSPEPEQELPDGLYIKDGRLMANCRSCERDYEFGGEVKDYDESMSYCAGSERCIP